MYELFKRVLRGCLWGMCIAGCTVPGVKSQAALCQIYFDRSDKGIERLNAHNARAILSFEIACKRAR